MAYYATITDLINSVDNMEISYRNLHTNAVIQNGDEAIKVPYGSVVRNYLPYFESTLVEAQFTTAEVYKYKFKPKRLSLDLYGTTELWSALLEVNYMYSVIDFNLEKTIKVFEPKRFLKLLNEVLILEGILT
jgi:hypothetical protein